MDVYFECVIRGVREVTRKDPETSVETTKFRTQLDDSETGQRLEVNCKKDLSALKDQSGVAKLSLYERDGGGFWITLQEFIPEMGININK